MSACDWSDGVLWPTHLHRWDCHVPCEHRGAGQCRAGSRVLLSAPPHLAVTEALMSSPSLCWSSSPVPPTTVPSRPQAWCHEDQSPGALWLPEPGQLSCFVSERTSSQHPRGRQAGSLSPPLALDVPTPWTTLRARPGNRRPRDHCQGLSLGFVALDMAREGRQGLLPLKALVLAPAHAPGKDDHGGRAPAHTFAGPCTLSLGTGWAPSQRAAVCRWGLGGHVPAPVGLPLGLLGGTWGWVLWTRRSIT